MRVSPLPFDKNLPAHPPEGCFHKDWAAFCPEALLAFLISVRVWPQIAPPRSSFASVIGSLLRSSLLLVASNR